VSTSYTVSALAKGLRVLSVFSEHRRELRLVEVAALTNLPVPTVFRLLKTLESEGYVEHLETGHFRPGPYVLSLGYAALQGQDVVEAARLPLKRLAEETAETVNLGTLVGTNVMYLARVKNTDLVTANVQVGSMLPAPCTSMGKLLLAFLPEDERDARLRLIDIGACQGPRAVRSMAQLRHQLTEARERGWALQDEEVAHGLRSISAPIRDGSGEVTAALNLAVQTSRWTRNELIDHFLEPLLSAAEQTSLRLGYVGAVTPAAAT
jgi:IclR family transcriptional regulator, pca regulon regulatory protein